MKRWQKAVLSVFLIIVLLIGTVIGGYAIFVNRKVDSEDVISLKAQENLALQLADDENSKLTDGKWSTGITVHDGDSINFKFKEPIFCNTIVLQETLNKPGSLAYALEGGTKQFSIYASLNGEEKLIYRNDKIDTYRMCTFPRTELDSLRIQFDSCRGSAKINEAAFFDVGKTDKDFRINDYFVYEGENYQHNEKFVNYLDSVTDLTLFIGIWLGDNGEVVYSEGQEKFEEKLADVRAAIGDRDIKLFCNVFSNDTEASYFADNSKKIAANLAEFVTKYELDGVDLDWEYPQGKKDWDAYNQLALDLHAALQPIGKKFSFAAAVWNMRFSDEAKEAVDYFNIMIYDHCSDDYNGWHSTFKETTLAIERLHYRGYDMSKICLGIPFYGREVKGAKQNMWFNYNAINVTEPWSNYSDDSEYRNESGELTVKGTYYNGAAMVADKTAYAIAMNCGGIMTWHCMTDLPLENELSLHGAINSTCAERLGK